MSVTAIIGLRRNIVDAGLLKPIFLFWNNSCVKAHRRPPNALALITSTKPPRMKCVSVATISRTPLQISMMTPTRRQEKRSKWKRNAKSSTNIREDDLTIALYIVSTRTQKEKEQRTIERQGYSFKWKVWKPYIETCGSACGDRILPAKIASVRAASPEKRVKSPCMPPGPDISSQRQWHGSGRNHWIEFEKLTHTPQS